MATIDILRRRIAMAQAKADEYEGVLLGNLNSNVEGGVIERIVAVSPEVDITEARNSITVGVGSISSGETFAMWYIRVDGTITKGTISKAVATAGIGTGQYKAVRFEFDIKNIDDVYVYSASLGKYLWAGKNVKQ